MKNRFVYFARFGFAAAAVLAAGCGPIRKDEGAAVEARATARWDLLIKHQAEKAYDYLSPGFRQTITREKYAQQKNDVAMRWQAVRVTGHECDADTCTIHLTVDAIIPMPGIGKPTKASSPLEEHWIRVDHDWFVVPDTRLKAIPALPKEAKPAESKEPQKPSS